MRPFARPSSPARDQQYRRQAVKKPNEVARPDQKRPKIVTKSIAP